MLLCGSSERKQQRLCGPYLAGKMGLKKTKNKRIADKQGLIPLRCLERLYQSGIYVHNKRVKLPTFVWPTLLPSDGGGSGPFRACHVGTITHSDTRVSRAFPTRCPMLRPKVCKAQEQLKWSSSKTATFLIPRRCEVAQESAGVIGPRQRRRRGYLGSTCVTVTECRPGGGSAGSLSSWKNLYEK